VYILSDIDQQKASKLLKVPISKIIYTGARVVIFTKRPVIEHREKEEQLSKILGLPVVIASYTHHLKWYVDQVNGEYYASSTFAKLRAEQAGVVVKLREDINPISINAVTNKECWIEGLITDKTEYGFIVTDDSESMYCKLDLMFEDTLSKINIGDKVRV